MGSKVSTFEYMDYLDEPRPTAYDHSVAKQALGRSISKLTGVSDIQGKHMIETQPSDEGHLCVWTWWVTHD